MTPFSHEQATALVNVRQAYEQWMAASRQRAQQPYGMRFVRRGEGEYLYEFRDRSNNGRSLGPRDAATERRLAAFLKARQELDPAIDAAWQRLQQNSRICRALYVPLLVEEAGKILVELDKRGMLGSICMVAGTNAVLAYNLEAGGPVVAGGDVATNDFDIIWARDHGTSFVVRTGASDPPSLLGALKAIDETYTVNEERPFQMRNRGAYEVEILVPPSQIDALPRRDRIRPATNLHELEWLLLGTPVEQVTPVRGDGAARIVAPDPRMFALQKLYIAEKPNRDALKRHKDRRQATAILEACRSGAFPRHPLTSEFIGSLPPELAEHWKAWAA